MRVKKNTIKKMVRKQMLRNYYRGDICATGPWATLEAFESLNEERYQRHYRGGALDNYDLYRSALLDIGEAFRWLSKVEYDAKFTAAIRNRMPEILRDTADNLAARILEQLPDGYWKP